MIMVLVLINSQVVPQLSFQINNKTNSSRNVKKYSPQTKSPNTHSSKERHKMTNLVIPVLKMIQ